ncbi:MAG: lyase family protein [Candidatus Woesearchaeota archaeon]
MTDRPTYEQLEHQVASLTNELREQRQMMIHPVDYKYWDKDVADCISGAAQWRACANVQVQLMAARHQFGLANDENVQEMQRAYKLFSPANANDLEGELRHDQLAVIAELSKYTSQDTHDKMHPGTTSYDILDTARNWCFKKVVYDVVLPKARSMLRTLVDLAEQYADRVQVGRTHGQFTSPITFGQSIAIYASRLDTRIDKMKEEADSLQGKISGIVGTYASVGTVIGLEKAREFERYVVEELLGLKVCLHSTQVVSKEELADYGNAFVTMMGVLADMANTMRHLQRSEIGEVSGRETKERLGGSSADPSKNNPIQFENANGVWEQAIAGMNLIYHLQVSDHQRDLRGSVQARFEPQTTIAIVYDALKRMDKTMGNLAVNEAAMDRNLSSANAMPAEAMNAILKAHCFKNAHEVVKGYAREAARSGKNLVVVAFEDSAFKSLWYNSFTEDQRMHLRDIKLYTGLAVENTRLTVERLKNKYHELWE